MEENFNKPRVEVPLNAELIIINDEKDIRLILGNSGLKLAFGAASLEEGDNTYRWFMHFTPELSHKPRPENKIRYSLMFTVGFMSLINALKEKNSSQLSALLAEHPIGNVNFNTNDMMWNFVRKLLGEKYFMKIPQDFSKIQSSIHGPIRRLLNDIKNMY
ncbi:hypothetical protein A3C67_01455 [Candidatus Nomurabacteria bacterium RIFCSPHIGHO2_02_FULL_42_19]|uniref:Uncharacterized protein n=1 Tax=Candidatus Nomurabacteria bacterium RIFCSPHIGHO2_02_FULL_42_19 TaxID=1801756 RepID=A0A1F6W281_9BACT|nr:MAG: hypothetical protein A3C67_01455 [Candidatus Nomurabacteria bacterium RIFCSPHIGHO2_02_FULL_42_19]